MGLLKCGLLIAVHHHYEQAFIRHAHEHGSPHPDLWTLNYLSRVICESLYLQYLLHRKFSFTKLYIVYPAIGDAIDEGMEPTLALSGSLAN